ncbi:PAS domain-containing protein [Escherichia coli]
MHYMKWIYPRRLRNQMILMAILMVIVPTLTIGYIVETEGRSAVLSEKEKKLSAVVNLLNQALGNRYDLYIDLPREERIRALNAELAPITENITHAFPGIGAGYYNKTLDAIITYAPSALYQNNVGVTIAADHPGREVMRTNTPLVYSGRQVRGDILNSMIPIERNGEILGYIWANELTEDIRRQAWKMDVRIIIVLTAGLLISLLLIVLFSRRLSANIDIITDGLSTLAQNIPTRLPQLPGEMGQISQSVNNLAQALRETRTLNDLIIENAADGVIAIDRQGDVTTMNPAAEVITGYQRHELVGQPYSMLFDNTQFYSPTNRDLQAMVKEGTFREDLFYRLNVIHLILPPLRDRREDISLLANHFLQKFSSENQRDIIDIDPMAMSLLTAWSWPGNIRELSNVIERAVVMNSGPIIFSEDLPPQIRQPVCNAGEAKTAPVGERNLKEEIKRVEKRIIMEVLEQQEGNRTRTALMLGISRRALMYKLQEYGIDPADV